MFIKKVNWQRCRMPLESNFALIRGSLPVTSTLSQDILGTVTYCNNMWSVMSYQTACVQWKGNFEGSNPDKIVQIKDQVDICYCLEVYGRVSTAKV